MLSMSSSDLSNQDAISSPSKPSSLTVMVKRKICLAVQRNDGVASAAHNQMAAGRRSMSGASRSFSKKRRENSAHEQAEARLLHGSGPHGPR